MHACVKCAHHDPAAFHQCRESAVAEHVAEKAGGNFCESFAARTGARPADPALSRADADRLFGSS